MTYTPTAKGRTDLLRSTPYESEHTNYRLTYLVNGNLRDKGWGYTHGDLMIVAGTLDVSMPDANDIYVCEWAFEKLNRDDRPFGQTAPSMSVGDVVCITGGDLPGHRYYACDRVGFLHLPQTPIEFVPSPGVSCADVVHAIIDKINTEEA